MTKKTQHRTRRANGEGSIYQRGRDGRWIGYITNGFDDNGNPKRKFVYGKTRCEVAKKLTDLSGRIKSLGYEIVENNTFGELMLEWLMTFKKNEIKPRSFEGNIRNFKLHINPIIGDMKIDEIDTFVIQKLLNKMIDKNYSTATVKKVKNLINQFFEYSIDNKWININPVHKIKIRSKEIHSDSNEYKALSEEGRLAFINALKEDEANFLKPFCYIQMFAGLRVGEAIALKWEDVNFEKHTLKINRAITQEPIFDAQGNILKRKTIIGTTKTACSIREIPVADIVMKTLNDWKIKQSFREQNNTKVSAKLTEYNSYIFANDDGSVRTYSGCKHILGRFVKRHNLENYHVHFHGLRHTFSNMLFEMNENPKAIQQFLGHRDVRTTISVYNSVDNEYIRQSANRLNNKINILSNTFNNINK